MADILIAWELGGGYGHHGRLLPVARALLAQGHRVRLASRGEVEARAMFGPLGVDIAAAPQIGLNAMRNAFDASYAELLLRAGYGATDALGSAIRGWLDLYRETRPDLLLADHAPTALLAARWAGLRRAAIGHGYIVPALGRPMPSARPWMPAPPELVEIDAMATRAVAQAATAAGHPPLTSVADLFDGVETFLTTFPELDQYGPRPARYFGSIYSSRGDLPPVWPHGEGPRVFVYLPAVHPFHERVTAALIALGAPTLAYFRYMKPERARALEGPHLRISETPLPIDEATAAADLVICQGGHGTLTSALLAGRKLVLLPSQTEQIGVAFKLAKLRMALAGMASDPRTDHGALLKAAFANSEMAENARGFARRYAGHDPAVAAAAVAARCGEIATS